MMNKIDEFFMQYVMERSQRIQARLQNILDSNGVSFDLSTLDAKKVTESRNALLERNIELIQEIHTHTLPHTEIWRVKVGGNIIGQFDVDVYGVITEL